jgi:hypothetical protein
MPNHREKHKAGRRVEGSARTRKHAHARSTPRREDRCALLQLRCNTLRQTPLRWTKGKNYGWTHEHRRVEKEQIKGGEGSGQQGHGTPPQGKRRVGEVGSATSRWWRRAWHAAGVGHAKEAPGVGLE